MNNTILVIGHVWPEPNSSAAGAHALSLLRLFKRQDWRVIFASPAQKTDHMVDLASENVESLEIHLNDSDFDILVGEIAPDYVMFDRFMTEEQFAWRVERVCPDSLRILDTVDLQFLRGARQQALKSGRKLSHGDLFSDLAKRECAAILRCDLSLIISDYEMELLDRTFGINPALLHHLPFMLDRARKFPAEKSFDERQHFVTIGNFRHAPNWDSVLYLQQIWPLIRKVLPHAQLHIYGSYPPKKATVLNNLQTGFLVKGWTEDAFKVLAEARVCLAPLRFGAGIKGKLIDAMQVATPSVTTDIGAEGMVGGSPWPGIIANSTEQLAKAAIELYQNKSVWLECQRHIPAILSKYYDADRLGNELISRIRSIEADLEQHRMDNFTGAMLRYHSMKSTEYMSRWIETKTALEHLTGSEHEYPPSRSEDG